MSHIHANSNVHNSVNRSCVKSRKAMQTTAAPSSTDDENASENKHILAERYKTKLCNKYMVSGSCPYEVRCMFAHGEEELRTTEENIRDGFITKEAIKAFKHQHAPHHSRRRSANVGAESNDQARAPRQTRRSDAVYAAAAYPMQQLEQQSQDCFNDSGAAYEEHGPYPANDYYYDSYHYQPEAGQPEQQQQRPAAYIHNPYTAEVLYPEDRMLLEQEYMEDNNCYYYYYYDHNTNDSAAAMMTMEESGCGVEGGHVEYFPNADVVPIAPSTAACGSGALAHAYYPSHPQCGSGNASTSSSSRYCHPYGATAATTTKAGGPASYYAPAATLRCMTASVASDDERMVVIEP